MIGYNKSEIIGKLRERVTLQNLLINRSNSGFIAESWENVNTYWTSVNYRSGFEEEEADRVVSEQTIIFTFRYNNNINEKSRLIYRNSLYQVEKVTYSDDRSFMYVTAFYRSGYILDNLVNCIANIVTSSNLTAALKNLIDLTSTLQASSSLSANLQLTRFAASSLNANASLNASALVSKLAASSLTGAGTLVADLTVGGAFDADAQAFFDRVTTAGGTLSSTEKTAVNTLVIALKADGIWDKMKAIYPMVGASAAACAQNLKSSSFTGTFTASWTFASTGIKGNGTSSYFNTNFNVNTNASLDGFSFGGYLRLNLTTPVQVDGIGVVPPGNFAQHNFIDASMFSGAIGNIISYARDPSQRMFIHRRTSATISESYRNGISLGTSSSTAPTLPSENFYIGARNNGSGAAVLYTSQEYAFYFFGLSMTNQNALDLTSIINTFQTTLSRQV
jgi:SPP1 family predicted phage head-tail adaptor